MVTDTGSAIPYHAVIYSAEWAKATALKYLCSQKAGVYSGILGNISGLTDYLDEKKKTPPDVLVLDIPARNYVSLLCYIRRQYPVLPIIITQPKVLFSDRVVAGWFGNIWLREYDSLMAGYPETLLESCVTDSRFSGINAAAACSAGCGGEARDGQMLSYMERWLSGRLAGCTGSERCAWVVTEWLSRGVSPREVGARLQCSDKLVYHYRWRVIRVLGISGHPGDFIPSLSLKLGPDYGDCRVRCKMRAAGQRTGGEDC